MLITFKCPYCKATLRAGVKLIGTKGKCPNCNKEITVPDKGTDLDKKKREAVKRE